MGPFLVKNEASSIDKARLVPRELASEGWPLGNSTTIFSIMDYQNKPLPPPPSRYIKSSTNFRARIRPGISSFSCENRTSTSSDSSNPGMIEDTTGWSGSESTMDDHKLSETDYWDSYFWPNDQENISSSIFEVDSAVTSVFCPEAKLSPYNRNFASANLSGLQVDNISAGLHHSGVTREPRRLPKSLPHNIYSPSPPVPPPGGFLPYDSTHKPWPLHQDTHQERQYAQRPPLRSRAYTTPAKYTPLPPSNLSTCSTLEDCSSSCHSSTSSASGLYMRSSPVSPNRGPPLMDLMEKSYFEDDSDDESDEEGRLAALAIRLRIRSASSTTAPSVKKEKSLRSQKSLRNLKVAGGKLKGILRTKKVPEIV